MFSISSGSKAPLAAARCGGFGLVELLVSVSIIVLITGVVLVRENSFNGAVALRNQAYNVAIEVREIQLSAVSAEGSGADFRRVRGIYFEDSAVSDRGRYIPFEESTASPNGFWNPGEETSTPQRLNNGYEIRDVRTVGGDPVTSGTVSVIFVRPNFDARFFDSAGNELNASALEILVAREGSTGTDVDVLRTIEITATGQIGVQ